MAFRDVLETFSEEEQLDRLHELSSQECDALFDLLMAGALMDGELSQDEADMLAEEFAHLPFFAAANTALVKGEHGFMRRGELLERLNTDADALLDEIAERLQTEDHRTAALRALALVVEVGGVEEDELGFTLQAASAFGVDKERALEILRKAWDFNHPPFA